MKLITLFTLAFALAATEAPKPPTIPAETRARFWRAYAEQVNATGAAEKASAALQAARAELVKACGDKHDLTAGPDGEPTCVAKPEKPAEPSTK